MNVNELGPITKRSIETMQTAVSGRSTPTNLTDMQKSALVAAVALMRTHGYPGTAKHLESILVRG